MIRTSRFVSFLGFLGFAAASVAIACSNTATNASASTDDTGTDDGAVTKTPAKKKKTTTTETEDSGVVTDSGVGEKGEPLADTCVLDPGAPTITLDAGSADPYATTPFTLKEALAGFPAGDGKLTAVITTELSWIRCTLDETNAPVSVANFIGLARGTRPFKDKSGAWKVGRFYDGLIWHRVIPDFVIQGGDPLGTGTGGPGFDIAEENHVAESKGTLAMAAGAKPSGSQFYIVTGTGPAANYNVFGTCTTKTAIAIAAVETDSKDKPVEPVHMTTVDIARCP